MVCSLAKLVSKKEVLGSIPALLNLACCHQIQKKCSGKNKNKTQAALKCSVSKMGQKGYRGLIGEQLKPWFEPIEGLRVLPSWSGGWRRTRYRGSCRWPGWCRSSRWCRSKSRWGLPRETSWPSRGQRGRQFDLKVEQVKTSTQRQNIGHWADTGSAGCIQLSLKMLFIKFDFDVPLGQQYIENLRSKT